MKNAKLVYAGEEVLLAWLRTVGCVELEDAHYVHIPQSSAPRLGVSGLLTSGVKPRAFYWSASGHNRWVRIATFHQQVYKIHTVQLSTRNFPRFQELMALHVATLAVQGHTLQYAPLASILRFPTTEST